MILEDYFPFEVLVEKLSQAIKQAGKKAQVSGKRNAEATPKWVVDLFLNRWQLTKGQYVDICCLRQEWRAGHFYNALVEPWPRKFIFVNPPYDACRAFIWKALLEYFKGSDIILLVPIDKLHEWKDYVEPLQLIFEVEPLFGVAFGKHEKPLHGK